jgi:Na+/melibiose symporter-like transporter
MRPVGYTQRFSYAASDTAGQLIFTVISFYLLKFYTDIAGLSALVAGNILLLARLVDSLDAPLWGIVFEKVHSKWGRSRPWFLWLCAPFALSGILTFATPHLSGNHLAIYAGATYIVCSVLYTGINTPVTAILSALTNDPRQRVALTTFRMFGSKAGVLIVNATLLPCIAWFGRGDDKLGIMRTIPIYAAGSIVLYLVAFPQSSRTDSRGPRPRVHTQIVFGHRRQLALDHHRREQPAVLDRVHRPHLDGPVFLRIRLASRRSRSPGQRPRCGVSRRVDLPPVAVSPDIQTQRLGMGVGRCGRIAICCCMRASPRDPRHCSSRAGSSES